MLLLLSLSGGEGGFNPLDPAHGGNLFWTLAVFLVSVPLIWKIVMGPVARALEERDAKTAQALAAAEKAAAEAQQARAGIAASLAEAETHAQKLLAEARARGDARRAEIVEAAGHEAELLVQAAQKAIRAEEERALAQIRAEVVDLSLRAASKVLARKVTSEDDKRLVAELVASRKAREN